MRKIGISAATGIMVGTALTVALSAAAAHAIQGDCSQPSTNGNGPSASDCLFILGAAVGNNECATDCVCDVDSSGSIVATDALVCLNKAVGLPVALDCTCPTLTGYAFDPNACPTAGQAAAMVATDYIGAFDPDLDPATGNWTAGWTMSLNGNGEVWEPAGAVACDNSCPLYTERNDVVSPGQPGCIDLPAAVGGGQMDLCVISPRFAAGVAQLDGNTPSNGATLTLSADNVYLLGSTDGGGAASQGVKIGNGDSQGAVCSGSTPDSSEFEADSMSVVIDAGTLILGQIAEAFALTRNSTISVNGTANDPVVFNSLSCFAEWTNSGSTETCGPQEWGGLILTGCGESNECTDASSPFANSCNFLLEGFLTPFYAGGRDNGAFVANDDNSGSLEYLVVRQAGFDIDGNGNELNAITMFMIGSGTSMSYAQVHDNVDDGLEWFGGAFNVDHTVHTAIRDDSIDTDLGFQGSLQFAVVKQADGSGDRGFEMDEAGAEGVPSQPCLANITVLGSDDDTEGINAGSGTGALWSNGIIKGSSEVCIKIENDTLTANCGDGTNPVLATCEAAKQMVIDNYYIDCPDGVDGISSAGGTGEFDTSGSVSDTDQGVENWYNLTGNNRAGSVDGNVGINSIGYPTQND